MGASVPAYIGDNYVSARFYTAIAAGCLPVVVADPMRGAFPAQAAATPPQCGPPPRARNGPCQNPRTAGFSAQARYASGVRETLECWFDGKPIRDEYLIMQDGKLAGVGAHSYSEGGTTGGATEAAEFKKAGGNV